MKKERAREMMMRRRRSVQDDRRGLRAAGTACTVEVHAARLRPFFQLKLGARAQSTAADVKRFAKVSADADHTGQPNLVSRVRQRALKFKTWRIKNALCHFLTQADRHSLHR
jgi:hypothetical protein